jgi:hypothetical protein
MVVRQRGANWWVHTFAGSSPGDGRSVERSMGECSEGTVNAAAVQVRQDARTEPSARLGNSARDGKDSVRHTTADNLSSNPVPWRME